MRCLATVADSPELAAQINENGEPEDWNFRVIIPVMLKLIQDLYERN